MSCRLSQLEQFLGVVCRCSSERLLDCSPGTLEDITDFAFAAELLNEVAHLLARQKLSHELERTGECVLAWRGVAFEPSIDALDLLTDRRVMVDMTIEDRMRDLVHRDRRMRHIGRQVHRVSVVVEHTPRASGWARINPPGCSEITDLLGCQYAHL